MPYNTKVLTQLIINLFLILNLSIVNLFNKCQIKIKTIKVLLFKAIYLNLIEKSIN
jgi:hypothetical protein